MGDEEIVGDDGLASDTGTSFARTTKRCRVLMAEAEVIGAMIEKPGSKGNQWWAYQNFVDFSLDQEVH